MSKNKKTKAPTPENYQITEKWNSFALAVLPPETKEPQFRDMKMAFMAGAYSCFCMVELIGFLETELAVKTLENLKRELGGIMEGMQTHNKN